MAIEEYTIDYVFAMLTHSSEFKLLVPPAFFPVADIAQRKDNLQDFIE
jgi:hypothetical protein